MTSTSDHGGNVFSLARQLGTTASRIIDFSASINPLGLSPLVKESLTAALDSLVHYPDSSQEVLKQALADFHGVPASSIVPANGSTELIYQLPLLLTGSRALIVSPAFSEYERALMLHKWEVRHFILQPEADFEIDLGKLEQLLSDGYQALYLCNPGNPTGKLYPLQFIEQVAHLCKKYGTFLVLDEAFMDFCEDASAKQLIITFDNAVILRSMTKFFAIPGLRLGYAIAGEKVASQFSALSAPWNVNTLALAAGSAAIQDSQHNRCTVEFVREERNYLCNQLARFQALKTYPSEANFLLIELTKDLTASELKRQLLDFRVLIRDCANFSGLSPYFFRIAVRIREENVQLLECLKSILK
ncbi:MAG: threonine-phosphate decarboxylase CobD [Deltaproteobacteria bacterium]